MSLKCLYIYGLRVNCSLLKFLYIIIWCVLRRECCTFSNGEYVKSGVAELEKWIVNATEEVDWDCWYFFEILGILGSCFKIQDAKLSVVYWVVLKLQTAFRIITCLLIYILFVKYYIILPCTLWNVIVHQSFVQVTDAWFFYCRMYC